MSRATELYTRLLLDAKDFTKGLEQAKKDTLGFGKNLTTAGKAVEGLKGLVGKLGTAVGVAGGAYEAFNATINSNRDLTDKFKGSIEGGKIALDRFFTSLSSGDWSGFLNGISSAIAQGLEFEKVLNRLQDFQLGFGLVEGEARAKLEQSKRVIEDPDASLEAKEEARKVYQEQITKLDSFASEYEQKALTMARTAFERYGNVTQATDEQVFSFLTEVVTGRNEEFEQFDAQMRELESKVVGGNKGWSVLLSALTGDADVVSRNKKAIDAIKTAEAQAPEELVEMRRIRQALSLEETEEIASYIRQSQEARQMRDSYKNSTKELEGTYKAFTDNVKKSVNTIAGVKDEALNPLQQIDKAIAGVTQELSFPTDTTDLVALRELLKELQERKAQLEREIKMRVEGSDTPKMQANPLEMKVTPVLASLEMEKVKTKLLQEIKDLESKLSVTVDVEERRSISSKIDQKRTDVEELQGASTLKLDMPDLRDYKKQVGEVADVNSMLSASFDSITSVVGLVSQSFDSSAEGMLQWASSAVGAIQQVMTAVLPLIATKKAEATANAEAAAAGAASAVASIPFAGPAMAVSAVLGLIAVLAKVPKFATGGVVGGNSYYGDKILARVNSGELILNKDQQATLYNQLAGASLQSGEQGKVEFKIRGQELVGVLDKHSRRVSRS